MWKLSLKSFKIKKKFWPVNLLKFLLILLNDLKIHELHSEKNCIEIKILLFFITKS